MTAVDRGTVLDRARDSLQRAREMLERYAGTDIEADTAAMVERYEARVAALESRFSARAD